MTAKLPPSRTAEQFVVRFPDGMRDQIADLAKKNGRSMNAEIINRLKWSIEANDFFERPSKSTLPEVDKAAQGWAEHMVQPENRRDLESLLTIVRDIVFRSSKGALAPPDSDDDSSKT
ncbi:Arc family DNA-binding protein [Achromobacter sp. Marseille-Q0513]|uniref:Arc family DNA-binding protein n=1 Tax=Achromobacter sp. Marseille-Q0513 TaxID=2829161 RepID=UPI001B92EF76|nr:Arc family DNA-binding protein [Achromobacter sp. Marseille-Q0513]MBR8654285.1 Arc family DNA-binding protein [Achromobacter sp. Marseille-Q0513]